MIIMLVGSVIFGVVVGGMTQLIAQLDAVTNRAQERSGDPPAPSPSPQPSPEPSPSPYPNPNPNPSRSAWT